MEENDYTLEQMRSDYQALKASIDRQEIVNDRLLRETMRGKVSSIRGKSMISVFCGVFVMLTAPVIFHYNPVMNASWWFVAATELMMAACLFFNWKFNHKVQGADLSSCDLLTFSKDVKDMKKSYRNWIKWGLTGAALWAGWLCAEVWIKAQEPKLAMSMIIGLAVGFVVGAFLGVRLENRIISLCDEIIDNIEE